MCNYPSPPLKVFMSLVFVVFIAVAKDIMTLVLCGAVILLSLYASGVKFSNLLKSFKPLWVFIIFLAAATALSSGIYSGVSLAVKFTLITLCVSYLTNTTKETQLQSAIFILLSPLKVLRIPIGEISFGMALVLRFIPRITNEWQKLSDARVSRGIFLRNLPIKVRIKILTETLATLILNSTKNAEATAISADSRCFGLGNFTPRKTGRITAKDLLVLFPFIIFCIFLGLLEFFH